MTDKNKKVPTKILIAAVLAVAVVAVGLLVLGGSENPEPASVDTTAEADVLVSETFARLESIDYELTVTRRSVESGAERVEYYGHSNSNQKALVGLVVDGQLRATSYHNDVATWKNTGSNGWELDGRHSWPSEEVEFLPDSETFSGANASVRERTDEVVVVEITNVKQLDVDETVLLDRAERWVVRIDAENGNIQRIEGYVSNGTAAESIMLAEFEYGGEIHRPDGISSSLTVKYYRLQSLSPLPIPVVVGGLVLIVGLVVYRHRRN